MVHPQQQQQQHQLPPQLQQFQASSSFGADFDSTEQPQGGQQGLGQQPASATAMVGQGITPAMMAKYAQTKAQMGQQGQQGQQQQPPPQCARSPCRLLRGARRASASASRARGCVSLSSVS